MGSLTVFDFEGTEVRSVVANDEPWWVGKDICQCLEISDHRQALKKLDVDESGGYSIPTTSGMREMICVNEPGLYRLIFSSRKEAAERFKRWLSHEVLPTLRKTGQYVVSTVAAPVSPDDIEYMVDMPEYLPSQDMNSWTRLVFQTERLYGRAAARKMWEESPLPSVRAKGMLPGLTVQDGQGALQFLLKAHAIKYPDMSLADCIEICTNQPDVQAELESFGLKVNPKTAPDHLVIASRHPALVKLYDITPWSFDYSRVLRKIMGCSQTQNHVSFCGKQYCAVMIPLDAVWRIRSSADE